MIWGDGITVVVGRDTIRYDLALVLDPVGPGRAGTASHYHQCTMNLVSTVDTEVHHQAGPSPRVVMRAITSDNQEWGREFANNSFDASQALPALVNARGFVLKPGISSVDLLTTSKTLPQGYLISNACFRETQLKYNFNQLCFNLVHVKLPI